MSATLDGRRRSRRSSATARILRSEGRSFPVEIEHAREETSGRSPMQVAAAVRRLGQDGLDGDVLVFLPGAAEIRARAGGVRAGRREARRSTW